MKTYSLKKTIFDVFTFVLVSLAIQLVCQMVAAGVSLIVHHEEVDTLQKAVQESLNSSTLVASSLISSLLTILIFTRAKWAPVSRTYLNTRPWGMLVWTFLLTLGTILPLEWLYEQWQLKMPETYEALFSNIMREPLGYVAVGLLAPLEEELVFRGAVLRVLLKFFDARRHWVAIGLSALIFAVVHGNLAQGTHAFLLGLLLGWLFYRSRSIVPGVVLHWTNNSIAYALTTLFPQMGDGQLIDFFHGSERALCLGLLFSLCIFLPSLYQLAIRLRSADADSVSREKR